MPSLLRSALFGLFCLLAVWSFASTAAAQDLDLKGVLIEGEGWKLVGEGYKFTEGPAADQQGRVYFTDVSGDRIHRVELDGKVTVFVEGAGNPSGLRFGPKGLLYCAQYNKKRVVTYASDAQMSILAEEIPVNDLTVSAQGIVYVTAPGVKQVIGIRPGGEKFVAAEGITTNGIALTADDGTLITTEGNEPILWTFKLEADGKLTNRDRYYGPLQLPPGVDKPASDGIAIDSMGRLYVATAAGLQMFDLIGRHGGTILKPQPAFLSNVCFGGPQRDELYVTCLDKVYKRKVKATGQPWKWDR